jgi:hypothetical protein
MRPASIVGLILVAAVVGLGLVLNHGQLRARLPDRANIENNLPIPQDAAKREKRRRIRLARDLSSGMQADRIIRRSCATKGRRQRFVALTVG